MNRWAVRIIYRDEDPLFNATLLNALDYAGLVNIIEVKEDTITFDLYAPEGTKDTREWANRHADHLQTLGVNAAAAPEWPR